MARPPDFKPQPRLLGHHTAIILYRSKSAGSKATDYGVVLTVWIALLTVTSLIELETRQALLAYSRGNSTSQTAAPIRFVLAMLFGIASWINAKWFANKKDLGQRNVASQLVDAKLLGLAPRLTMFCIGLLLTLLVLDPGADESAIASRLVLIAILAVGFFLSSPQLTLLAVLGLFTVDQVAPHSSDAPVQPSRKQKSNLQYIWR